MNSAVKYLDINLRKWQLLTLLVPLVLIACSKEVSHNFLDTENESGTALKHGDLLSTDGQLSAEYREFLKHKVIPAKIIGIGESIHGSNGFHRIGRKTIMHLVRNEGYRIIGTESSFLDSKRIIEPYLSGKDINPNSVSQLAFPYGKSEIAELLKDIRKFNQQNPDDPVQFFGFDFRSGVLQTRSFVDQLVIPILKSHDDELASKSRQVLSQKCVWMKSDWDQFSYVEGIKNGTIQYSDEVFLKCKSAIKFVYEKSASISKKRLKIALKAVASSHLRLHYFAAQALEQNDEQREMIGRKNSMLRDQTMAKIIELYIGDTPKKAIVWAHNAHISMKEWGKTYDAAVQDIVSTKLISTGYWLKKRYGESYHPIGYFAYDIGSTQSPSNYPPSPPVDNRFIEKKMNDFFTRDAYMTLESSFAFDPSGYLRWGASTKVTIPGIGELDWPYGVGKPKEHWKSLIFLKNSPKAL